MEKEVCIPHQVFTNEDGSQGVLYLATSDLTLGYTEITTMYQKRWKVEEYQKSIKSNLGLTQSPTKRVKTQSNHFFAVMYAFVKLELLSKAFNINHFALKTKLYKPAWLNFVFSKHNRLLALRKVSQSYYPADVAERIITLRDGSIELVLILIHYSNDRFHRFLNSLFAIRKIAGNIHRVFLLYHALPMLTKKMDAWSRNGHI